VTNEGDQENSYLASVWCVIIGAGSLNHGGRRIFSEDAAV
jgi:hypothetical protein